MKSHRPKAGDVAVFRIKKIGKHTSVQAVGGNNAYVFEGDHVMMVFGSRYATGQFEGYVPDEYKDEYQILGKGGAVGVLASMHSKLLDIGPTTVELIGYAVNNDNEVINTKYLSLTKQTYRVNVKRDVKIILSLGASMDSGKTTTAAYLTRGLTLANKKVIYIKLTGTVYTKDRSLVRDSGAIMVCDFSTVGFPSTYMCSIEELLDLYQTLLSLTEGYDADFVVMEIADGLLQRETRSLINNKSFMSEVAGVVFSASDSMSAMYGLDVLNKLGAKVCFVSGLVTASPLLTREIKENTTVPVLTLEDMESPSVIDYIEVE